MLSVAVGQETLAVRDSPPLLPLGGKEEEEVEDFGPLAPGAASETVGQSCISCVRSGLLRPSPAGHTPLMTSRYRHKETTYYHKNN